MNLLINYKNIAVNILPHFLRKDNLKNWVYAFIKPLETLHNDVTKPVFSFGQINKAFYQWYSYIHNFLRFNGQIIYLEKYLNSIYYPTLADPNFLTGETWHSLGGMWILDTASSSIKYVYNKSEGLPPIYVYNLSENIPVYLYNTSEVGTYDFIVLVPVADYTTAMVPLLTARINQYKLAGKRYLIATY